METENIGFYKYSENGIKKRNLKLWETIVNQISSDITFKEKFYLYENNLLDRPICECGSILKFIDMRSGYREFCSKKCMFNSSKVKDKRKETSITKYGVDNPSKCKNIREKVKETNNKKFGTDWASQNKNIRNKTIKTNIEKYGVDNPSKLKEIREKAENTMLEKWGVKHAMQSDEIRNNLSNYFLCEYGVDNPSKLKEIREKAENTMLEKWGVKHALQNKLIMDKLKNTNLERYGVEYPIQNTDIMNKVKNTNLERYGFDNAAKSDVVKEKIKDSILKKYNTLDLNSLPDISKKIKLKNIEKYESIHISKGEQYRLKYKVSNDINYISYIDKGISLFKCDRNMEHNFRIHIDNYAKRSNSGIPLCTVCNPIGDSRSIKEKELYEFIKSIYSNITQSYRDGLEIDIYLPELNLGFEFNGLYWHSEEWKDKDYHTNKTIYFKERGIRVIHIWEDDWDFRKDIIKSQIRNWIGLTHNKVFARKCHVREINSNKEVGYFLNENHIQGKANSCLKLGLYHEEELVSVMTFDHYEGRNKMKDGEWNLNRFCNKRDYTVIGGASKLFKYFINNYSVKRVVSYADKDWSEGNLYYKLGFKLIKIGKPDYKYILEGRRVHKSRFKKSNLGIKFDIISEKDYTDSIGLDRIYDCGKIKFEILL